jgi:hypothetical protein
MSNDKVNLVSEVLNLEVNGDWTVDFNDDLSLLSVPNDNTRSFSNTKNFNYLKNRGVIIDNHTKKVIVPCYEEVPTFNVAGLWGISNNMMELSDKSGETYVLDASKTNFRYSFEGTVIRMFYHNGKVYLSTNRKLDCSKSKWGSKKTFYEMFEELGGSKLKLFDEQKRYSPHCHFFVIVHPDLLICTKQDVGNGYLVYLGTYSCYDQSNCSYNLEDCDFELRLPEMTNSFKEAIEQKIIYKPRNLTNDEVNMHLNVGFWGPLSNNYQTGSGECVIACVEDKPNLPPKLYKFVSPSYQFREFIRDNDPNIVHRMYSLITESFLEDDVYNSKYPWLEFESYKDTLQKVGMITYWNCGRTPAKSDKDAKLRNLWKCLLLAAPLCKQKDVIKLYSNIYNTRKLVVDWLYSLYGLNEESNEHPIIPRASKLLQLALKYAQTHNVKTINKFILCKNLTYLVANENGTSLYKLEKNRRLFQTNKEINMAQEETL